MGVEIIVPVAFLITLIALVRAYSDYRVKAKLIQANASPETARLVITPSARRDLFAELKWGIVSIFIGLGIMGGSAVTAAQPLPSDLSEPFGYGIVIISAGVGLLVYYAVASRMLKRAGMSEGAVASSQW